MSTTQTDWAASTATISSDLLWERLQDKDYRESFVAAQLSHGIPYQVRELMDSLGVSQSKLAEQGRVSQATISRATDPHYASLTSKSIVGIAAGLDVAFIGEFVPFSKLIDWFDKLPEWDRKAVLTFTEESVARKEATEQPLFEQKAGATAGAFYRSVSPAAESITKERVLSAVPLPKPQPIKSALDDYNVERTDVSGFAFARS